MPERWRDALSRLDGVEPDPSRIRSLTGSGPRRPGRDPGAGRRIAAAVLALGVAGASFAFVVSVFGGDRVRGPLLSSPSTPRPSGSSSGSSVSSPSPTSAALGVTVYPDSVCGVPELDPTVALLVGQEAVEYPRSVLEARGGPASSLEGPASEDLRAHLETPAAVNAPADGWRVLASSATEVTFGSPFEEGRWWIDAFEDRQGAWKLVDEEIVEQRDTPAQRGHDLELRWDSPFVLEHGRWNDPLRLVNGRPGAWTDDHSGFVAVAHVFDPATGSEIAAGSDAIAPGGDPAHLGPGEAAAVPVALGAAIPSLAPGSYIVVACLPDLALASPAGTLRVDDAASVPEARVLTHHSSGASMTALIGGTLEIQNGCVAVGDAGRESTYLLLPLGYTLVHRGERVVLIGPTGTEVGAVGDEVSLGGGYAPLRLIEDAVIGGIPDPCRSSGESYFVAGG